MRTAATASRWCAAVLLGLYSIVIARLTLVPASSDSRVFSLLDRIMTRVSGGRLEWSQTEVLANVALFIPAGFLLAVILGRAWASALLCLLASAAIELAQQRYLPSRVPSIADVEHNGLGGLIGAIVAWPLAYWVRELPRRTQALV
jgi:glycopeptide antibiotics resistance protein